MELVVKKHPRNGLFYVVRTDGVIESVELTQANAEAVIAKQAAR